MCDPAALYILSPDQLRELAAGLLTRVQTQEQELAFRQAKIDKLTHELARHQRWRFGARTESFSPEQRHLFEDTLDTDLAALEAELDELEPSTQATEKRKPRRLPLPAGLPHREIRHEPDSTTCACGCALPRIGEDVAEKLDYTPGVFTVERHVRGRVGRACETLIQAPVPAHVPRHRQGSPHHGSAGPGADSEISRPASLVPTGGDLRPGRPGPAALDARAAGRPVRRR